MRDGSQIHLSRRRLIQLGGGATAALYLPNLSSVAAASGVPACLKRSSYAPLVGRSFGSGAGNLTLSAVSDLVRAQAEPAFVGRDDAFALSFTGPNGKVLQSGIHTLSNDTIGSFDVFINPVDAPGSDQHYEVVVDRSVSIGAAESVAPEPLELSNGPVGRAEAPPAAVTAAGAGGSDHATKPKPKLVEFASVARRGHALAVDVRVARGRGIVAVSVSLVRNGNVYGRASGRLHGRRALRLTLRRLRRARAGRYTLRVTTTDGRGRRTLSTSSVTLR